MDNLEDLRIGVEEMRSVAQRLEGWANRLEAHFLAPAGEETVTGSDVPVASASVGDEAVASSPVASASVGAAAVASSPAGASPVGAEVSAPAAAKRRGKGGKAVEVAEEAAGPVAWTFEQVRGLLAGKSAAGYRSQVLALIRSYGAEKLSEVDPARYGELVEAVTGLGASAGAGGRNAG